MFLSVGVLAALPALLTAIPMSECEEGEGSLYDHTLQLLDQSRNVSLSDYEGKVVMLVNVATYWGYASQYPDFNALKQSYDGDFEVLAVPSSNFFNQEPSGDPEELMNAIRHVRPGNNFNPDFPLFSRCDVNGANRIPLYSWVLSRCEAPVPFFQDPKMLYYTPISKEDIRWNYEKILIDRTGQPYRRYAPSVEPMEMEEDIQYLISL